MKKEYHYLLIQIVLKFNLTPVKSETFHIDSCSYLIKLIVVQRYVQKSFSSSEDKHIHITFK